MKLKQPCATLAALLLVVAGTEAVANCGPAAARLTSVGGYAVSVPPAAADGDWCVLDGASFRSQMPGWPDLAADRLRLRETPTEIDLDLQGLRASPQASDRDLDDRIRSLFRLQSADLRLRAVHDPESRTLSIAGLRLDLASGARLELDARVKGADLSPAAAALGTVTEARLVWRNDGRVLRPLMDLAGEGLAGSGGPAAVDAARSVLAGLVEALPAANLDDPSRKALAAAVRAMPQGQGKLTLTLLAPEGIGAGRLAVAGLSDDPVSQPGLAP
jgi:hypothetical protein